MRRIAAKILISLYAAVKKESIGKAVLYFRNYGLDGLLVKIKEKLIKVTTGTANGNTYQSWIEKNSPQAGELENQKTKKFEYEPKISIIVPVFNTPERYLKDMIESVLSQTYSNWELCFADGGSKKLYVKRILENYKAKDERIKTKFLPVNKGIAGNSNEAISLATGDFLAFLDHDDTLAPNALFEIITAINKHTAASFLYSDYAITDSKNKMLNILFCPDFSRFYYLSHPYIVHLVAIKRELLEKIGYFDEYLFNEGVSHDVDLFLRFFSMADDKCIVHIPKVLYYWKHYNKSSGHKHMNKVHFFTRTALRNYLEFKGMEGVVEDGLTFNTFRIRPAIKDNPLVSIIIPTKNQWELLEKCLSSIEKKSGYTNYEIIIVKNNPQEAKAEKYLSRLDAKYRVLSFSSPFNFSAINNYAVQFAKGKYLLFLNDDIEFKNDQWLTAMIEMFQFEEVGVVGAKLLYPDGKIQHAGVILGLINGIAEHWHKFASSATSFYKKKILNSGYLSSLVSIREFSAVTGACLMTRRSIFDETGGFSEDLRIGVNDIDFCLRVIMKGYKILYTPFAEAYHHESVSRKKEADENSMAHTDDNKLFLEKWKAVIDSGDPYYNPNLDLNCYEPFPKYL